MFFSQSHGQFQVTVLAFGGSDHDILQFTRYWKIYSKLARTIVKRSYKQFDRQAFLWDLRTIDWSNVYRCSEVDDAVELLTSNFLQVLDIHAPWIRYQQRKHYCPWITEDTKKLIKERNEKKKEYEDQASKGDTDSASRLWKEFKKIRNKINNRKKFEEKNFKSNKILSSLTCPSDLWRTTKSFIDWKKQVGLQFSCSLMVFLLPNPMKLQRK